MKKELSNIIDKGASQIALNLSMGKYYIFISTGFAFMITYSIFKQSPFFLFITWENFFIFYIMVTILSIIVWFSFGNLISVIKKYIS